MSLGEFYTRSDVAAAAVSRLPDFGSTFRVRAIEPSAGDGAFAEAFLERYSRTHAVELVVVEINGCSLEKCKRRLNRFSRLKHVSIEYVSADFFSLVDFGVFDIAFGNPPFGRMSEFRKSGVAVPQTGDQDVAALFVEKLLRIAARVCLILPKTLLTSSRFAELRSTLKKSRIDDIVDFREKAFRDVRLETLFIQVDVRGEPGMTRVLDFVSGDELHQVQRSITSGDYYGWIIYRNGWFDFVDQSLRSERPRVYRNRSLTGNTTYAEGPVPVFRARELGRSGTFGAPVRYSIDNDEKLELLRTKSSATCLAVPNMSYYPRAALLPAEGAVDGSLAVLWYPSGWVPTRNDLRYFASAEFFWFYRIASNFSVRTLNVDRHLSAFYRGKQDGGAVYTAERFTSADLFRRPRLDRCA